MSKRRQTFSIVGAMAALCLFATLAQAETGQFIFGGRLAYNYSNISYTETDRYGTYSYSYSDGGSGVEAGLLGRLALVEGQMGLHVGANFIYREPFYYYNRVLRTSEKTNEMAGSVVVLFEINPFALGGLNSSIYEMVFWQIGVQADYVFDYKETLRQNSIGWDREKINVGLVIGAVGYFTSYCSLDIRYYFTFNQYAKDVFDRSYLYSGSVGLSFYL